MTYELPAIGRPPDRPMLEKIAVEEHFDVLSAKMPRHLETIEDAAASGEDLETLVRAMDYDAGWMGRVGRRLPDFGADRIAGMDASGISVAILSHTVPGVQGIVDRGHGRVRGAGRQRSAGRRDREAAGSLCRVCQHRGSGSVCGRDRARSSSHAAGAQGRNDQRLHEHPRSAARRVSRRRRSSSRSGRRPRRSASRSTCIRDPRSISESSKGTAS